MASAIMANCQFIKNITTTMEASVINEDNKGVIAKAIKIGCTSYPTVHDKANPQNLSCRGRPGRGAEGDQINVYENSAQVFLL